VVIAAPTPIIIHTGNISIHLSAVFAMPRSIAIDPCVIRFKTSVAISAPVPIAEGRLAYWQHARDCESGSKTYTNNFLFHPLPPILSKPVNKFSRRFFLLPVEKLQTEITVLFV
jgi:hypothetical protein